VIGAVNGETLRFLVQHYLAQAALQEYIREDLEHEVRRIAEEQDMPPSRRALARAPAYASRDRRIELRTARLSRKAIPHRHEP
jgi:hypothetical protein